jgi:hypothetical protein
MGLGIRPAWVAWIVITVSVVALAADFTWDWRDQEVIGRTDTSLGNTSKLTEPERNAVLDAIIVRLMKPLADRGYDDGRIREIAITSRVRFVQVGDETVLMATSFGIEGGCDVLANCPFWVFRRSPDGYVSMLEAEAASYTIQPTITGGYSDLVLARHITPSETRLNLYKYADGKYADAGCYTATFVPPKEGESIEDPEIAPCKGAEG